MQLSRNLFLLVFLVLCSFHASGAEAPPTVASVEQEISSLRVLRDQIKEKQRAMIGVKTPELLEISRETKQLQNELNDRVQKIRGQISVLESRGIETADLKEQLIKASGQMTTDILDTKVAVSLFETWLEDINKTVLIKGPGWLLKGLVFVIILIVFRLLADITRGIVRRALARSKIDFSELLDRFFVSLAGNLVLIVGVLIALAQIGVAIGPLLAGLGIAGFIVGFALQDTLSNFASGMMILIYSPYDVGDAVEAGGVTGKVADMNLVSTTILTFDNQTLIIPNNKIWGDVIRNITRQDHRRVDLVFGISYDDDIDHAERVLNDIVSHHKKVLHDPAPIIKLTTLGESSVDFIVRPWVKTADYWDVHWDITREVKRRFDTEGISIPYPQRDVHVHRENEADAGTRTA